MTIATDQKKLLLEVKDLAVKVGQNQILDGLNLTVKTGEIHAIMGPNGSGKSTLAKVLVGHPGYEVVRGEMIFYQDDKPFNLLELEAHERALMGLFLAFQYPVEVPGLPNDEFLRAAFNARRRFGGEDEVDPLEFAEILAAGAKALDIDASMISRQLNVDLSGGEKKRNEILQMAILNPLLTLLDETDSGLDVDALKVVTTGINRMRRPDNAMVLITHYHRILDYVKPDFVHILSEGRIIKTGDSSLAMAVDQSGYAQAVHEEVASESRF